MKLEEIFTKEVIDHLKANQHEINSELLEKMRSFGKKGKQLALDILDCQKDPEQYYLDAFGNRISFDGNRRLKKSFTKMPLSQIHLDEIKRCKEDVEYFKDNYVKIKVKSGINFPDIRPYQNEFIEYLCDDSKEDIVGLMPRQSSKTISTSIYLVHCVIFMKEINIGVTANRGAQAREFLSNVKNIFLELPIWLQVGLESWNKSYIEAENGVRILTDVPSSDSFRGFTISILVVDETAFIKSSKWDEFSDSIFPSQAALSWKKNIILSTANGMNHFYNLVKGAREGTNGMHIYEVSWKDVPRFRPDGTQKSNEEFQNEVISKHGVLYFNQNFANAFLGSSNTLVSTGQLEKMIPKEVQEIRDGKLNIYHYPQKGHRYIMTVDAAKEGIDAFSVQVVDITDFNFKQAAAANLQIDYLLMPEFLNEWCEYYNNPYLIIENNEGAGQSVADQMFLTYEYQNLHFDRKADSNQKNLAKSKKGYPGFRTTAKTRKQILQTMKLFIENNKLEINDNNTIKQLYQFILINNKYQADDNAHDDLVMSLAIVFAPFVNTKNFDNMKAIVQNLYNDDLKDEEKVNFGEMLSLGSFDDMSDEEYMESNEPKTYMTYEEAIMDQQGFY